MLPSPCQGTRMWLLHYSSRSSSWKFQPCHIFNALMHSLILLLRSDSQNKLFCLRFCFFKGFTPNFKSLKLRESVKECKNLSLTEQPSNQFETHKNNLKPYSTSQSSHLQRTLILIYFRISVAQTWSGIWKRTWVKNLRAQWTIAWCQI